jgi:hypothetical protein
VKKFLISCLFVVAGSGLWWGVSNTARFSIKKWDAKFDSVLRHSLTQVGLKNEDLLSSVNELKSDANGEFVVRRLTVKKIPATKINEVVRELENAGADVKLTQSGNQSIVLIKRGSRLYQEISFTH